MTRSPDGLFSTPKGSDSHNFAPRLVICKRTTEIELRNSHQPSTMSWIRRCIGRPDAWTYVEATQCSERSVLIHRSPSEKGAGATCGRRSVSSLIGPLCGD